MANNKSVFGELYAALGNDPSDKLQAAFIAWAKANLPNRDVAEPSSANAGDTSGDFSTAGAKVDHLIRCYRSREDTAATYSDAMTRILNQPENRELKIAFSKETGRSRG